MAASLKQLTYALTGANALPADVDIIKQEGAAIPINVTPGAQINNGVEAVLYKGTRKVLEILSAKNYTTATNAEVADAHVFAITADGLGVKVTAAANIPTTTHFKLFLMLGY